MKIFLIALTVTLLFCFGIANAQSVSVSDVTGVLDNNTKVSIGLPVTWTIRVDAPPNGIHSFGTGFRVFLSSNNTPDGLLDPGPGFYPITYSIIGDFSDIPSCGEVPVGIDGYGADTIGFYGISSWSGGMHMHEDAWTINTQLDNSTIGNYLCIDSSFFPPWGVWMWGDEPGYDYYPYWDGPHCYLIEDCCKNRGDVVGDSGVFIDDLSFLRNYVFLGGPPPDCLKAGDVIVDDIILVNDLVFLVNYIFKGGDAPPPCD